MIIEYYYVHENINMVSRGPQRPNEMAKNVFIDY